MTPAEGRLLHRVEALILDHMLTVIGDAKNNDVYVVQVGANDGRLADPVAKSIGGRNWSGLLIEPVPYFFKLLQENYAGAANVELLNAACGPEPATLPFWQVTNVENLPLKAARGVSSFRQEITRKHFRSQADFDNFVERVEIRQIPLDTLLRERKLEKVDILCVDTEGYDYQVMRGFDLAAFRPDLVIIEHLHLPEQEFGALLAMMSAAGYGRVTGWLNCYFYRPQAFGPAELQMFNAVQDRVLENTGLKRAGAPAVS